MSREGDYKRFKLTGKRRIQFASGSVSHPLCRRKAILTILDPAATAILSVSLFFIATVTAEACSAALPTMGRRINPTNSFPIFPLLVSPFMEDTSHSDVTATSCVISNVWEGSNRRRQQRLQQYQAEEVISRRTKKALVFPLLLPGYSVRWLSLKLPGLGSEDISSMVLSSGCYLQRGWRATRVGR